MLSGPLRPLRPRPARRPPPHPVETHNPFGEWRNPHHDDLLDLRSVIEKLPPDYDASAAYIRMRRPSTPALALRFWNTMEARAHAMIAILQRGPRTICQLHEDLGVGHDKIYTYLPRWKVDWRRRPDQATAQDPAGDRYPVIVEQWHANVTATVRLSGYAAKGQARWLADAWEFRLLEPLTSAELVTPQMAARLLNLSEAAVARIFPVCGLTAQRKPLVSLEHVSLVRTPTEWADTITGVSHALNPCRCAHWHPQTNTCSLQPERALPERGTARYSCEDHHDLS